MLWTQSHKFARMQFFVALIVLFLLNSGPNGFSVSKCCRPEEKEEDKSIFFGFPILLVFYGDQFLALNFLNLYLKFV